MHYVVTLVERDFLYGACVLFNSLIRNGFGGRFVIGYRNPKQFPKDAYNLLTRQSRNVLLIKLDTELHFTNFKPAFMLQVLDAYPDCSEITYIDPDIVVHCPFSWLESWSGGGPAVCADVNWWLPADHPTRKTWQKITKLTVHHQLNYYYNGGFLSLKRNDAEFLVLWNRLIHDYGATDNPLNAKGEISAWRKGGRWLPFMSPSQDTLNVALMAWPQSISTLGPDVMGFTGFGELPHAIGSKKPWDRNYLCEVLKGFPPRYVDKVFWSYANFPLQSFSSWEIRWKKLSIRLCALLSRSYKK